MEISNRILCILSGWALVALLLGQGCDGLSRDYQLSAQRFANALELQRQAQGGLYGRILFPSAYTQRSVRFTLSGRGFVTQPDGRFVVKNIPVGEHRLNIRIKNYEPISALVTVSEERRASGPWRLKMARGKVIGRLVGEGGKSAANVALRLSPLDGIATSDEDGIFQFLGVNSGDHTLRVQDERFFTYNRRFNVERGEQRNLGNIQVYHRSGTELPRAAGIQIAPETRPVVRELSP